MEIKFFVNNREVSIVELKQKFSKLNSIEYFVLERIDENGNMYFRFRHTRGYCQGGEYVEFDVCHNLRVETLVGKEKL